jgi:CRP-like cAMP-binding protein
VSDRELKRFPILAELAEGELELLEELLEPVTLRAGQQLFREGQEADGLVLLQAGRLRFESDRAGELGEAEPGAAVGAFSLVVVGRREATAVASEDSEVLRLSRTAFHRFAEDSPRGACRVLEAALRDLAGALRKGLDRLG